MYTYRYMSMCAGVYMGMWHVYISTYIYIYVCLHVYVYAHVCIFEYAGYTCETIIRCRTGSKKIRIPVCVVPAGLLCPCGFREQGRQGSASIDFLMGRVQGLGFWV